ncbi:MAG: TrbI/VirB10 family protein [Terricaulis sp.]
MTSVSETPDVAIRAKPPSPKRLSRKVLFGGAALAGMVIAFAVVNGLSANAPANVARQQAANVATNPPQSIAEASSQYEAADLTPAMTPSAPDTSPADALAPPQDPMWRDNAAAPTPAADTAARAPDPETVARTSPILFTANAANTQATDANAAARDPHLQAELTPPHSRYEIQAGNVIPAALVTGLNSDAPGRVIAQVTAPVYDSVSGAYLLIPQGARLLGTYDNSVHYGDERIVLTWDRLILPNGWSIDLASMNGADPTGAAGLKDSTDNHLWRLGGAVGLSAIISVIANNSEGSDRLQSLTQNVGDAAAQQAAQSGSQIVSRELSVRPTLRVRPGASVRVLVTRDIALRPYVEGRGDDRAGAP